MRVRSVDRKAEIKKYFTEPQSAKLLQRGVVPLSKDNFHLLYFNVLIC